MEKTNRISDNVLLEKIAEYPRGITASDVSNALSVPLKDKMSVTRRIQSFEVKGYLSSYRDDPKTFNKYKLTDKGRNFLNMGNDEPKRYQGELEPMHDQKLELSDWEEAFLHIENRMNKTVYIIRDYELKKQTLDRLASLSPDPISVQLKAILCDIETIHTANE